MKGEVFTTHSAVVSERHNLIMMMIEDIEILFSMSFFIYTGFSFSGLPS